MKYCDIKDFKSLRAYCYKVSDMSVIYINPTSPFHTSPEGTYLGELHASPTKSLGYRLLNEPVTWCRFNTLKGIIYSYDTPIGLISGSNILFVTSSDLPFKSATTKKLVTILNRNFMSLELSILYAILNYLNIDLGWLK